MNYLARASTAHNYITTSLILLMLLFVFAMAGCDAPSDSLDVQGESSEPGKVVTAESLGYEITLTDLGTFNGEGDSYASDINDKGQIVGAGFHPQHGMEAVIWENGEIKELCNLVGDDHSSEATSINNNGAIAGHQTDVLEAFLIENDKLIELNGMWRVVDINNERQVAGISDQDVTGRNNGAAIWENGNVTGLGVIEFRSIIASSINESGLIAGDFSDSNNNTRAFLWNQGEVVKLGTLGGEYSIANSINESGQIVGNSRPAPNPRESFQRGFLWEEGKMNELAALSKFRSSARSINDDGQIVGFSYLDVAINHAVLWIDGNIIDLGALHEGGRSSAASINNHGQIVGSSTTPSGDAHAVLWEFKKIE